MPLQNSDAIQNNNAFQNNDPIHRPVTWLVLVSILEAAIFYAHVQLQIAPNYPQVFDQLSYMTATDNIIDDFARRGIVAFAQPFLSPLSTGITYPVQGALAVLALGSSRAALLTVNLIYFLAAQTSLFFTARRVSGEWQSAWVALAVFIACIGLFKKAGGIADYRIDFAAMCLFGIWVCALSWTDNFTSRTFSVVAGLIAGSLVLMRFITAAYIGPILIILLFYVALSKRKDNPHTFTRMINWLISGLLVAVLAVPELFRAMQTIKDYYVAGHLNGDEPAIRATEVGVSTFAGHLIFYPKALMSFQIGTVGMIVIVAIMIAGIVAKLRQPRDWTFSFDVFVFLTALIVPMLILTLDVSKSPVVIGIVLVPVALLVCGVWHVLVASDFSPSRLRWFLYCLIFVGVIGFAAHAASNRFEVSPQDQLEIRRLNIAMGDYGATRGCARLAFDRLTDYLNGATVRYYFRQGHREANAGPVFTQSLGGIFSIPREAALAAIRSSDMVVLSDKTLKRGASPFEASIVAYWDAIDEYAANNLSLLTTGIINDIHFRIFVRPDQVRCDVRP